MAQKIVTVFGGGGFIGRYAVRLLAKHGWIVRIAQRRPNDALFLRPAGNLGQIDLIEANIRDPRSVVKAMQGSEAVINLVGILAPSGAQKFEKVHSEGAANIASAASSLGLHRLIHLSAIGADLNSRSLYARSKAKGENEILRLFPRATILRPSIVFGPEDQFFNRFADMARFSPFLPLIGGGRTLFQPTYVEDVAAAILRSLEDEGSSGQVFELGGPDQLSFAALLRLMLRIIEKKRILLPIPFSVAYPLAFFMEKMPGAPLTVDQLHLLKRDNIVSGRYPGYTALGIEANALTPALLSYLSIYKNAPRKNQNQEQK